MSKLIIEILVNCYILLEYDYIYIRLVVALTQCRGMRRFVSLSDSISKIRMQIILSYND